MNTSKNEFILLAIVAAVVLFLVFRNWYYDRENVVRPISEVANERGSQMRNEFKKFAVYPCTANCSGHRSGYAWAEEHDIKDGEACDTAGDYANSPSFAEGCHAYVDGANDSYLDDDD